MAQKYNKTAGKKEVKRGYKKKLITPQLETFAKRPLLPNFGVRLKF